MKAFLDQFRPEVTLPHFEKVVLEKCGNSRCDVLHLATGNLFGGVETNLINMFRRRELMPRIQLSFALMFPGRLRNELQDLGAPLVDLCPVRMRYPWQVWRARRLLRKHLNANRPGLVISHSCWTHAIFSSVAKKAGVTCALWLHDRPKGPGKNRSWSEYLAAKAPPDILLCNSNFTKGGVSGLYPRLSPEIVYPVTDLHCPLNLEEIKLEIRKALGCPADRRVVLTTSRFDPYKGHMALIDGLGAIGCEGDWECWIANEPQNDDELNFKIKIIERAKKLGIEGRMRWLGHRSDVKNLYAAANWFCQPNLEPEPFGQVFLEAQVMGCPVMTFGMGGALEAVGPISPNIILEPGNTQALTDSLRKALLGGQENAA